MAFGYAAAATFVALLVGTTQTRPVLWQAPIGPACSPPSPARPAYCGATRAVRPCGLSWPGWLPGRLRRALRPRRSARRFCWCSGWSRVAVAARDQRRPGAGPAPRPAARARSAVRCSSSVRSATCPTSPRGRRPGSPGRASPSARAPWSRPLTCSLGVLPVVPVLRRPADHPLSPPVHGRAGPRRAGRRRVRGRLVSVRRAPAGRPRPDRCAGCSTRWAGRSSPGCCSGCSSRCPPVRSVPAGCRRRRQRAARRAVPRPGARRRRHAGRRRAGWRRRRRAARLSPPAAPASARRMPGQRPRPSTEAARSAGRTRSDRPPGPPPCWRRPGTPGGRR